MAEYYFNLPNNLTTDQQLAVDEPNSIALYGGPGTGKTVVNLLRHIYNYDKGNKRSLLLTYTKTLEYYLKKCAKQKNQSSSENIDRTYRWTFNGNRRNYDEIIVDEAQDVTIDRYHIINNHSKQVSYGADPDQSMFLPSEETRKLLNDLKKLFSNKEYTLYKNFRNSKEILLFTQATFPEICIEQQAIDQAISHNLPFVAVVGWEESDMIDKIMEIITDYASDTSNIGILVPTKNQVNNFYNLLQDKVECTKFQTEDETFTGLKNIHITTFKSSKGIEFDTVIIPNFDSYQWFIENTNVIMNEYYVALTRAKTNLFLICKNELTTIDESTYETE